MTCAADDTIEPPWLIKDDEGHILEHGVDANGVWHTCKDTNPLRAAAELDEVVSSEIWKWSKGDTVTDILPIIS